jgi:DegV family protein with EDD domain
MMVTAARVAIVTDSTACIPPELAARYGIEIVPVHLIVGGRTYADSLTTDTGEFYERVRTSGERATTAAPSPGTYVEAIGRAAQRAESVLVITVSAQFSAMFDSARAAVDLVRADGTEVKLRPYGRGIESPTVDVRLFDSRNAAMAQGFVVLEAARLAETGAGIDDVIARAEEMTGRVSLLAMLDTLSYLARSGRVPRVASWAAGVFQVKPIVRFTAGDIKRLSQPRTRARGLEKMATIFAELTAGRRTHLAVHHANAPDDAGWLLERVQRSVSIVESHVTEFTQVMGVHTGPGLVGLAWWCED